MTNEQNSGERSAFSRRLRDTPPDPHGHAALILTESILHSLIETKALSVVQAIDAVRTAFEVTSDIAAEMGEVDGPMQQSLGLLGKIEASLMTDRDAADQMDLRPLR